jgi:hypothetical protein
MLVIVLSHICNGQVLETEFYELDEVARVMFQVEKTKSDLESLLHQRFVGGNMAKPLDHVLKHIQKAPKFHLEIHKDENIIVITFIKIDNYGDVRKLISVFSGTDVVEEINIIRTSGRK